MEGPRAVSKDESPLVEAFLREFSPVPDPGPRQAPAIEENRRTRAFFLDGAPASLVLYTLAELVLEDCTIRTAELSLLATKPDCRGQGFATLLLEDAFAAMRAEGIRIFFAPSAEGIFGRLGARRGGLLWRAQLRPGELPPGGPVFLRFASPGDAGILWRLHREEEPRFARDEEFFRRLPAGGESGRTLLILQGGRPAAYVFLAFRPEDPSEAAVLEYAGERRALALALRDVFHRLGLGGLEICVPSADRELLLRLRAAGGDWRAGPLPRAIAILDPEGLWTDLGPRFARRLGEAARRRLAVSSAADGAFGLRLGEEAVSLADPGRLVNLFFGEEEEAGSGSFLPPVLRRVLGPCLPLPLPWDRRFSEPAIWAGK